MIVLDALLELGIKAMTPGSLRISCLALVCVPNMVAGEPSAACWSQLDQNT